MWIATSSRLAMKQWIKKSVHNANSEGSSVPVLPPNFPPQFFISRPHIRLILYRSWIHLHWKISDVIKALSMQQADVKSSTAQSSKAKTNKVKADSSKIKPKAVKNNDAPRKPKAKANDLSSKVTQPQLEVSKERAESNPLGVAKTRIVLKKQEMKPQQSIRKMLKQAEAFKEATAEEIKKIREGEAEARRQEEEQAKQIAKEKDPTSAEMSKAELENLQNILINHANTMEEFKDTCLKKINEQQQYINELADVLSTVTDAYHKLMTAHKSLNRTHQLKPDPLKDEEQREKCFFCYSTKHAGMLCYQFPSAIERRIELERERRCLVCYIAHAEKECQNPRVKRCNCGDNTPHHFEVCFKKASKEAVEQKRNDANKRKEKENGGPSA